MAGFGMCSYLLVALCCKLDVLHNSIVHCYLENVLRLLVAYWIHGIW